MKAAIISLIIISLVVGLSLRYYARLQQAINDQILIRVKIVDEEELEDFPEGSLPWISIKNAEGELDRLIGGDEIVLQETKALLIIDYPVAKPIEIEINASTVEGFRRAGLVRRISSEYHRIYREEESSAKTKTIPIEQREGIINRNQTDGKYGIWGHDIDDLVLSAIIVHRSSGIPKLELIIES